MTPADAPAVSDDTVLGTPGAQLDSPFTGSSMPLVKDAATYAKVPIGAVYVNELGARKTKPLPVVNDQAGYDAIPEGGNYLNPKGQKKIKPKNEPVDLGTQTLFDMARDPETQQSILASHYGEGNVKRDASGYYVDDPTTGKRLRPGGKGGGFMGGLTRGAADLGAQVLPIAGAVGGAIAGAPAGGVGGFAGAGLGYAAGAEANQALLTLAGYQKPRTAGRMALDTAKEVVEGGAFEAGGRVLGTAAGSAAAALETGYDFGIKPAAQTLARSFAGTTPEIAKSVLPLAEKGYKVPPTMYAPEAPMAKLVMRAARYYGYDPAKQSVAELGPRDLRTLMTDLGVPEAEINPNPMARTAAVDYTKAGEAAYRRYNDMMAASDAKVSGMFQDLEAQARARGAEAATGHAAAVDQATAALNENRAIAKTIIDSQWRDIADAAKTLQNAPPGAKPGDMVRDFAGRLNAFRQAIGARFRKMYGDIDQLAGGETIDATGVAGQAQKFVDQLPEDIQRNHPALIRALADLQETGTLTYGQAHHLRSMLGDLANWQTLAPSFKNGQYKYFRGVLDDALHDPENTPVMQQAVQMLDATDAAYAAENARFKSPMLQRIIDWTESNLPPSPGKAAGQILAPGEEESRGEVRKIVGESPWNAVIGADVQASLDASKSTIPGRYDGKKFVSEFLDRDRAGILADYPPAVADLMRRQARYVEAFAKDKEMEVDLLPTDDFGTSMRKVYDAAKRMKELTDSNPVKAMEDEIKSIRERQKIAQAAANQGKLTDPLHPILSSGSAQLAAAAEKIAKSEDLVRAAASRFGRDSDEFQLIRQAFLKDLLTTESVEGAAKMHGRITGMTPEVQDLYFGFNTADALSVTRAFKELLTESEDLGGGIYATGSVTHPESAPIPGVRQMFPKAAPGFIKRIAVGKALDWLSRAMSAPGTVKFIAGNLKGTPEQQALAKSIIKRYADMGGAIGAGVGADMASQPKSAPRMAR